MTQIKCILFDIGGVLVDWHMSWITSEISKRFDISEEKIIHAFDKYLPELDSGKIQEDAFWKNVGMDVDSLPLQNISESLWDTYFRKNAKPNSDIKNIAKVLKENGFTIGIISNIEKVTHDVVSDWNVLDDFEYFFMSYQIGFAKPDLQIYSHVIKKLPFQVDQILFIDDKILNVDAARSCGISSIHFTDLKNFEKSLNSFDVWKS